MKQKSHLKLTLSQRLHIDPLLFGSIVALTLVGLLILFSASSQSMAVVSKQSLRLLIAFGVMFLLAQIPPHRYSQWAPWLYTFSILLLLAVLIMGHVGKGAQRWLNLGLFRFQPSELLKISAPMMLAWWFSNKALPPNLKTLSFATILMLVPVILILKQPDLGTGIIIAMACLFVIFLAGIQWRYIIGSLILTAAGLPIFWHFLHHYQKERILTFINPERHPLGAGYHIIQSKIAIGSGGLIGKGWLNGTQSHLQFLPEHSTDFIFAVFGEEFGFIGSILLIALFLFIMGRSIYIISKTENTFKRLLGGSMMLTFLISFFINIGMVTGILPVVGVPLPLISYGGTSMLTIMASFGILMSIRTHRSMIGT